MTKRIDAVLAGAIERGEVAGVVAVAINRDSTVYEEAFGKQRVADDVDMRVDSIFRVASMTKGLTSVAAMQLVDSGELALDEPAGHVHPELAELSVIAGDSGLRPAARPVTLRHLLTHTSGFAYPFTSPELLSYMNTHDIPHVVSNGRNIRIPLLFDPGERWQYGVSTDWVGELVEYATGMSLPDYMRQHLFEPLRLTDTTFALSDHQEPRLTTIHARSSDGTLVEQKLIPPQPSRSGGAGLLSTGPDYARFLGFMLSDGTFNGERLLSPECMAALVSNQTGAMVAGGWKTAEPDISNDTDFTEGGTARHSLGFFVSTQPSPSGRSADTLSWAGIFNTYYWIDRSQGLAGAIFMQVRPFADETCLRLRDAFEAAVYGSVTRRV